MRLSNPVHIFRASYFMVLIILSSCHSRKSQGPTLFQALDDDRTGLHFTNKLTPSQDFNLFKYMYFYNGAGVGAGDFNNDGLVDLFFASNQGNNTLYLNKGDLKFADVTKEAHIPNDGSWSTGVSVVDINNDGMLDIYVCRVGKYEMLNSHNQLLICQGIDKNGVPTYVDKAREYGVDFSGFSTQAAFLDYDMDGDLDMFLLNHSVHENGTFRPRGEFTGTYHPLSGSRIFRNDGNKFTDVTRETGINSSAIGYGLGVVVADINLDGYPDIYVGNDFHENDYLYINQHNGTFKETLTDCIMHTSQFSMGVDAADINNDGFPDIVSMDMLPSDPYILKRSLGEDEYNLMVRKLGYGYNSQFTRNNLQLNRRNGMFSEVGLCAGIYATDWSWSPLWMDFDNDGLKDLFISNGIPKRMNDIDYINYISNEEVQGRIRDQKLSETDVSLSDKFPQIKIPNRFFKNTGQACFTDVAARVGNNESTYSNGAVYADLDNDGDLDVVVNNIDQPAILYENTSNNPKGSSADIVLHGPPGNLHALGAKAVLFTGDGIRTYENFPVKGFQSSMQIPIHIGLEHAKVDSAMLVWPDNSYQPLKLKDTSRIEVSYRSGLPRFNYSWITEHWKNPSSPMVDITHDIDLLHKHEEDQFVEFDREPLLPHMLSTEGPALAVADVNHDGLEDVFIGSAKREKSALFLQSSSGKFYKTPIPALDEDSTYEDVDACWADVNNDGHPDLIIATGGNEYYGKDAFLLPRVYINDGHANLTRLEGAFSDIYVTQSCVVPCDFNGDGYVDLFIGGRSVPWDYGQVPRSYLLMNDGKGRFKDVTATYAKELMQPGFVTHATWCDIDNDGDKDLVICCEWSGIDAFINNKGHFTKRSLTDKHGWWNFILPVDIDHDGDTDFVAGNLGLNSRLKASDQEPVRLYYNDFDGNGKKEQVVTYYLDGKEIPFANKGELEKQMPVLKKRFLYAQDFARATLQELFTKDKLSSADVFSANYFANAILINKGKGQFEIKALPHDAQLTSYRDAAVVKGNKNGLPDVMIMGNYYDNNVEMGRYDADFGTMLLNTGRDSFDVSTLNGLVVKGQVRHIRKLSLAGGREAWVLARNNDSTLVISFKNK